MTIIELKAAIEAKKTEIKEKQAEIDSFEYSATDSEYDDFINEIDGEFEVFGLTFSASDVLKNCDPVAYRCGKSDYESDKDLDDVEEFQDLVVELAGLEAVLEELQEEAYTEYSFFVGSLSEDELKEEANEKGLFFLPGQSDDDIRSELLELFENNN